MGERGREREKERGDRVRPLTCYGSTRPSGPAFSPPNRNVFCPLRHADVKVLEISSEWDEPVKLPARSDSPPFSFRDRRGFSRAGSQKKRRAPESYALELPLPVDGSG